MKQAKVIVLAGQSNAVGAGFVKYLPRHYDAETVKRFTGGYDRVKISYIPHDIQSEGFVNVTVNCTEEVKDTFGPKVGMADYLTEACPDEEFFMVKCADHSFLLDAGRGGFGTAPRRALHRPIQLMNTRKRAYAEAHGHRFMDTVTAGLTTRLEPEEEPDVYHYDAGSVMKLGRMFGEGVMGR